MHQLMAVIVLLALIYGGSLHVEAVSCPDPGDIEFGYRSPTLSEALHFPNSRIRFHCDQSFTLIGPNVITCQSDGDWSGFVPRCVSVTCQQPPIKNGGVLTTNRVFARNDQVRVMCDHGYYYPGFSSPPTIKCVNDLHWTLLDGQQLAGRCQKYCPWPVEITHGTHSVEHASHNQPEEGDTVSYYCDTGYSFAGSAIPVQAKVLTCRNSQWVGDGQRIECVIAVKKCANPPDIKNGNWNFRELCLNQVGCQVEYECQEGYIMIGSETLTCGPSQFWSASPPRCVKIMITCPDPPVVDHSTAYCDPPSSPCVGYTGVKVSYVCDGPEYHPTNKLSQIECLESGKWSAVPHACVKVDNTSPSNNVTTAYKPNTITAVIATASSILGILLIVIVVVLIQRCRPRAALWTTNASSPPAYQRQRTDSIDEHDRVALIAVAEGVRVVLPSYDEAVRGRTSRSSVTSPHRTRANLEYRPLPRIPSGLRASGDLSIQSGPRDDTSSNHPSIGDSVSMRRQSTLTIGMRDGVSENFGSIDTMNVSDTSTAVTLGTYDSSASNPSLASHKAAAGSLTSESIATEEDDAPLLEGSSAHSHVERTTACQTGHHEEHC